MLANPNPGEILSIAWLQVNYAGRGLTGIYNLSTFLPSKRRKQSLAFSVASHRATCILIARSKGGMSWSLKATPTSRS
jgi:hypothetical protein